MAGASEDVSCTIAVLSATVRGSSLVTTGENELGSKVSAAVELLELLLSDAGLVCPSLIVVSAGGNVGADDGETNKTT